MTRPHTHAFTLLELLLVIGIFAILISIWIPEQRSIRERARSVSCMNNLRQMGVAVSGYLGDHDGWYPEVETNPSDPVYQDQPVPNMLETFSPYGMTGTMVQCPSDIGGGRRYDSWASSYEWRPTLDEEVYVNPVIYTRRGPRTVSNRRLRLITDIDSVHFGRQNALYADGHVKASLVP